MEELVKRVEKSTLNVIKALPQPEKQIMLEKFLEDRRKYLKCKQFLEELNAGLLTPEGEK